MADPTDAELERLLRETLADRARSAPTALGAPVLPRGRRRTPWLAAAAAAAVVAVAVPLALGRGGAAPAPPATTSAPGRTAAAPTGWRPESYAGVELSVPPSWGWGGTPVNPGVGAGVCAVRGATVGPDGSRDPNAVLAVPYVGRPVLQSDACAVVEPAQARPDVDAVWFGSPLPVGDSGDATTVEVAGQRVSVLAADPGLREQVLATVHALAGPDSRGCPATASGEPVGPGSQSPLVVCAYSANGRLLASWTRSAAQAQAYVTATSTGEGLQGVSPCPTRPGAETVLVGVGDVQGGPRWDTVQLSCLRIVLGGGGPPRTASLSAARAAPWAGGEATAYLLGPDPTAAGPADLVGLFRGILG